MLTAQGIKESCEALADVVNQIYAEKKPFIIKVTLLAKWSDTAIVAEGTIYRRYALFNWHTANVGDVVDYDSRDINSN